VALKLLRMPTMRLLVLTFGLGAGLLLFCGQADAQYQYADAKGVTKTTQYKVDVPRAHRDAAVWIGPTGIGKPGLSEEARQTKQRDDEYRRIGEASSRLVPYQAGPRSGRFNRVPVTAPR
jgi:hypothetical protein